MKYYHAPMKNLYVTAIFAGLALFCSQSAFAENATSKPLEQIYACAAIADNAQRLECFDKNVAQLKNKDSEKNIIIMDKTEVVAAKKAAFGLVLPKIKLFEDDEKSEKISQQDIIVEKIGTYGSKPSILTNDGQIWVVTDEGEIDLFSKPPYKAKIKAATFGSYLLQFEGKNLSYRVKRVQ